jgi:predicted HTH transcriptional regulator
MCSCGLNIKDVPVNVPVNVTVNSNEEVVLNILKLNPQFTYEEIAIQIGKTRKTVSRIIANLKAQGMIKRRGSDKSGEWVVIKN